MEQSLLVDLQEIAQLSNCSVRTMQRLIERGAGPPIVDMGCRRILFRRGDVEAWLGSRVKDCDAQGLRLPNRNHCDRGSYDADHKKRRLPSESSRSKPIGATIDREVA